MSWQTNYHVFKELDRGSFGSILRVTCKKTNINYVAKCIDKTNNFLLNLARQQLIHWTPQYWKNRISCKNDNIDDSINSSNNNITSSIKDYHYDHNSHLRNFELIQFIIDDIILNETNIQLSIKNNDIVQIIEYYNESNMFIIIMEECMGGNLFDLIINEKKISNNNCKIYITQLINALKRLHTHNILHRDIKSENILLSGQQGEDHHIILGDFGHSIIKNNIIGGILTAGTLEYAAPEVVKYCTTKIHEYNSELYSFYYDELSNEDIDKVHQYILNDYYLIKPYSTASDVWSVGIVLYEMLIGSLPWKDHINVREAIIGGKVNYDYNKWFSIDKQAKDLVQNILKFEPKERMTLDDILDHPWLKEI